MTTLVFILLLAAFLAILPRLWREEAGLYSPTMVLLLVYVFLEYARPQTMHPELDIIPWAKLTMAALLACVLLGPARHTISHPQVRRQNTLLFAYVGVAALSVVVGINPSSSVDVFIDLVKLVVFYFVMSRVLNTRARLSVLIWMMLIIHVKLALHHIRAFVSETNYVGIETAIQRGRSVGNGFLGNAGDFGVALCVILPLALFVIWSEHHRLLRFLGFASLLTFMAAICSTGSRGAFVGLLAIGTGTWLKTQRKVTALAVLAGLGVVGFILAPEAYWNRMATIVDGPSIADREDHFAEGTKRTRLALWKAGLEMAFHYPVVGVGIGNFGQALDDRVRSSIAVNVDSDTRFFRRQLRRSALAPHNMFIQALTEVGFIGLLLILWSFIASFRRHRLIRLISSDEMQERGQFTFWLAHALDLSLVGLAVSGSFLTVLYYPHLWVLLGLSVAMSNIVMNDCKSAEQPESEMRSERRHFLQPASVG